ncbi:type II secretion system F family protein [Paenarthrobacter sp. NPDC089675]|uniref:type II secretion system F family protein n=1 Tax=Paenarthrobacter sp. NPDC089675 TaxID=3364376 RepID=UPI003824F002
MNVPLMVVMAAAAWLLVLPPRVGKGRARNRLSTVREVDDGQEAGPLFKLLKPAKVQPASMVVLVQQLAALLRGGRRTSQLWEELWTVHGAGPTPGSKKTVSAESLKVLAAARAAAAMGNSPADAIRSTAARSYPIRGSSERRIWAELAACLEIAELSGCPLADLLTRFAAQLEAEEDAEAARQTALAGPKATVRLLSWLPVFGLVLGMALGVDPLGILLKNPLGIATFTSGLVLTVAGRMWSSRLVASAAEAT